MEASPVLEEAARLGLLPRLQAHPCSVEELSSCLGLSERVVGGLMERMSDAGLVEQAPGAAHPPTFRLMPQQQQKQQQQQRQGGGRRIGVQPKVGRHPSLHTGGNGSHQASPHSPQHGYLAAGMVAYHAAPYGPYGQHVLYYPTAAGMAPYQQPLYQQGPAPGAQWHQQRPGMPGQPQRGGMPGHAGQQLQQAGPGGYSMGAVPRGPPGHYGYAGFPGGPMAPHTPAASGSQQRQPPMAQAGSSSSASAGSTGWGGVPLSQSAAEAIVGGAQPRPGSSCSQELPTPLQLPPKPVVALVAATEPAAEAVAHTQLAAAAEEEPGEGESASLAGPSSSSSDAEEAGSSQRSDAAAVDASISNGGGSGGREGKPEQAGSSSEGSSGDSRRSSRGSRERQPCAFFLKTGTCAYGDSCKFAHPLDKAPRVEFNSLGLPLRPEEPECAFYVKNYRCAFGHTCKFHHPELPAGPGLPLYAMAPGYPVPGYPMGATVGSPVLGSVLGLHGKPGGPMGGPGPHLVSGASPPGGPQGFYMPSPYAGGAHPGFHGRPPAMFPAMPQHGMGARAPREQRERGNRAAAPAALTPPAAAPPPPPATGLPPVEAAPAGQAAAPEPAAAVVPDATVSSVAVEAVPAPIMVFSRQQQSAEQLTSALEQLQMTPEGEAGAAGGAPGGGNGEGAGKLTHQPQQQADVLAAA